MSNRDSLHEVVMITRAFIQEAGSGRLGPEERDLIGALGTAKHPGRTLHPQTACEAAASDHRSTLVAGGVPVWCSGH